MGSEPPGGWWAMQKPQMMHNMFEKQSAPANYEVTSNEQTKARLSFDPSFHRKHLWQWQSNQCTVRSTLTFGATTPQAIPTSLKFSTLFWRCYALEQTPSDYALYTRKSYQKSMGNWMKLVIPCKCIHNGCQITAPKKLALCVGLL